MVRKSQRKRKKRQYAAYSDEWACSQCTLLNDDSALVCLVCEHPRDQGAGSGVPALEFLDESFSDDEFYVEPPRKKRKSRKTPKRKKAKKTPPPIALTPIQTEPTINPQSGNIQLEVPFSEKEEAKRLGAFWNTISKKWEVPVARKDEFQIWLLPQERIWLQCPFDEKDEAKSKGAKWDNEQKFWYIFKGVMNPEAFSKWLTPGSEDFKEARRAWHKRHQRIQEIRAGPWQYRSPPKKKKTPPKFGKPKAKPRVTTPKPSQEDNGPECSICLDKPPTYACIPCGHKCVCEDCVPAMQADLTQLCPLCRSKPICWTQIYD